jgi:hypothetical protein
LSDGLRYLSFPIAPNQQALLVHPGVDVVILKPRGKGSDAGFVLRCIGDEYSESPQCHPLLRARKPGRLVSPKKTLVAIHGNPTVLSRTATSSGRLRGVRLNGPNRDPYLLGMGVRVGSDEALLARWLRRAAPVVFWYGRRGQHDMSHVRRGGNLLGHFDITSRTPTYRANTNSQRNRWEGRDSCMPHCKTRNVLDLGSSLCTQHQNQQDR